MGGQDGYALDKFSYDSESNVVAMGLTLKPIKKLRLGLDLLWTDSEAGMDPFDLSAPSYVETHASTSFDFSQAHTYSDLDTSLVAATLKARYKLSDKAWLGGMVRYADYSDDAPYMYDTSGSITVYALNLGLKF